MTEAEGGAERADGAKEEAQATAGGGDDLPAAVPEGSEGATVAPDNVATEPIFTSLLFVDDAPSIADIAAAFRKHLWPSKNFGGAQKDEAPDESHHFAEEEVPDEEAARAWARGAACEPLLEVAGRPAWRLTVLRAPPPSRSAVVVRMHRRVGDGSEGDDLSKLEASLGVPLQARPKDAATPAKEERAERTSRKRARSASPQAKVRSPAAPGKPPNLVQIARAKFEEIDAETREPVEAKKALQNAIDAALALRTVSSNQKGGGGCELYHEHRVLLYASIADLPAEHCAFAKERFEHMGKVFKANTMGSYRNICDEIEGYLRPFV